MVYSRNLTRRVDKYDKRSIMTAEILDSCYIFDISDGGSLVASRVADGKRRIGDTLFDLISPAEADFLLSHCKSYTSQPAVINTRYGIAVVFPHLMPAASCCVLCFPTMGGDEFCIALSRLRRAHCVSPEAGRVLKRRRMPDGGCLTRCRILLERTDAVFSGTEVLFECSGDITDIVADRIYDISCYAACPAGVVCGDALISVGDFDFSLFVCFIVILMFCARCVSPMRAVSVTIEQTEYGAAVTVSFEVFAGIDVDGLEEIRSCRRMAFRRNLLFEVMSGDSVVHIRFSPVRREWSYLELKSPEKRD
ncbi:MAG: hypothetical protein IJY08_01590 [Clostridia bacterium]|nr:hypothetical protein [Clostridia bacterium]